MDNKIRQVTTELNPGKLFDLQLSQSDITYQPVPNLTLTPETPVWRVRLDLAYDPAQYLALDINGEIVLGRGDESGKVVSLAFFDAGDLGVSRRHVMVRPTDAKLYVIDLGSTNGTRINGRSIGVNTPYSLSNGDMLSLGQLEFLVRIIRTPLNSTTIHSGEIDLVDLMSPLARTIASQLRVDDVLKQALKMTVSLTGVAEASIWLVDEHTGELFLEAEQGIQNEQIRHMRLSVADSLAGRVIESGKPVHANRQAGGSQIKVKTGYLVEAVLYVPLIVGGVTIGVLMAAHHANGKQISSRDEKIVATIADFAAVAVQNARLYQATTSALTRRAKVLTALNYALSYDLKQKVNAIIGYGGLLQTYGPFETDITDIIQQITHTADTTAQVIEDLLRIAALTEEPLFDQALCDLVEIVGRAISTQEAMAAQKKTSLAFQVTGEPYPILGDAAHLCRSVFNLIDNAIKYSPSGAQISILLNYTDSEISLMVRDTGPGIPEEDLSLLFDQYYRGQGGIGLGLEQVRSTIEAHRGLVQVRNADSGGAEFTIILPGILRVKS